MENFWTYSEVLAPSVGVALIFWFAMRSIFRADRSERAAEAEIREEYAGTEAGPRGRVPSAGEREPRASQREISQPPES